MGKENQMDSRIGFVNTYPPTHCGIAAFSFSLMIAKDIFWPAMVTQYLPIASILTYYRLSV